MGTDMIDLWENFREASDRSLPEDFTLLQFGNTKEMADDLANLVMAGEKTATSSLVPVNDHYNRKVSDVGDCYLLLGGNKECLAFLQVTKTDTRSFDSITPQFAKEEGDGTFECWLEIHQAYYGYQMTLLGETLQADTNLHCEWFEVIYDLRELAKH